MPLLDNGFENQTRRIKPFDSNWEIYWYHSCFIILASFSFPLLLFFEYVPRMNYGIYLSIIELAFFWRYIAFFEDIMLCFLLAIFGISWGAITFSYLSEYVNSVFFYNWFYSIGPHTLEGKIVSHIILEASAFSVFFTIWAILPPIFKNIWQGYYSHKL